MCVCVCVCVCILYVWLCCCAISSCAALTRARCAAARGVAYDIFNIKVPQNYRTRPQKRLSLWLHILEMLLEALISMTDGTLTTRLA